MSKAKLPRIKVLIADDDGQQSRRLASYASEHGFECKVVNNGIEAKSAIMTWKPKLVLVDLMLPEFNAYQLLEFIRNEHSLRHHFIHVIVMSGHNAQFNVKQALKLGAKDYIVKPAKNEDILKRLVFHCRSYRKIRDISRKEFTRVDEASLMLHLTDLVLRQAISEASLPEMLYNLTRMVSMKVDGVRCSIVHCVNDHMGVVVTSNDNRGAAGLQIDLNKYPEILNVMNTGLMIAIENLDQSPELKGIKTELHDVLFNSMVVCPVTRGGKFFGVLSLRMPAEKETITDNEIRFVEIVSHIVSLLLSNQNFSEIEDLLRNRRPASGDSAVLKFPATKK